MNGAAATGQQPDRVPGRGWDSKALLALGRWPSPDPATVVASREAGGFKRTIENLSDDELSHAVLTNLTAIREASGKHGFALGDDLLPLAPLNFREYPEGVAATVNNSAMRVRAARLESRRREERQRQRDASAEARARELLEELHAKAPAATAALVGLAREAAEAHARVTRHLRDLELLDALPRLVAAYDSVQTGAHVAADTLGKKVHKLPELPELPDVAKASALVALLLTPRAADRLRPVQLPDVGAGRAHEAAMVLREAGAW